jgi:hypothetical protein
MSFSLPTFNLSVKINREATGKIGGPDVSALGNLAWGRRVSTPGVSSAATANQFATAMVLLLPLGTDIRDGYCGSGPDYVEAPSGSGRWYRVAIVDDIGKGFANEHRAAVLFKVATWPEPIP